MADVPKVMDAEKESLYGYVFGVSGPGLYIRFIFTLFFNNSLLICCNTGNEPTSTGG